ncbi:hypothetical protein [uncultured Selenomonas sp.]|uniref:hypothetical protein n=1 Tax=uncultured Selenomonas sp. TaxID=159275 RepID=UPI0025827DF3|nr:hypothetical protein [uncultured Selenomonas sp.]
MANEPGKIKEQLESVYEYCFVETVPYAFFKPNPARDIAVNLRAKEYRCPACGKVTRVPYRYHGDTYFSKGKLAAERRTYDKLGLEFPTMGRIAAGEPFVNEAVGYCAACAKERLGASEDPAQRVVNLAQQLHRADALVVTAARLAMEEALRRWLAAADAETLRQFDVSTLEKTRDLICAIMLDDTAGVEQALADYRAVVRHVQETCAQLLSLLPEVFTASVARSTHAPESMSDKVYHEYTVAFAAADAPREEFYFPRRVEKQRLSMFLEQPRVASLVDLFSEVGFHGEWLDFFRARVHELMD